MFLRLKVLKVGLVCRVAGVVGIGQVSSRVRKVRKRWGSGTVGFGAARGDKPVQADPSVSKM
jgi:hypothetical protein